MKRLNRSSNKIFGGVLGGFADYFQIDPVWLRLGYLVLGFANFGAAVLLYIVALIIMPKDESEAKNDVINVESSDASDDSEGSNSEAKDVTPEDYDDESENNEHENTKNETTDKKAETKSATKNTSNRKPLIIIGLGLIIVGLALLFEQIYKIEIWSAFVLYYHMLKEYLFALLLIFFGFVILFRGKK